MNHDNRIWQGNISVIPQEEISFSPFTHTGPGVLRHQHVEHNVTFLCTKNTLRKYTHHFIFKILKCETSNRTLEIFSMEMVVTHTLVHTCTHPPTPTSTHMMCMYVMSVTYMLSLRSAHSFRWLNGEL